MRFEITHTFDAEPEQVAQAMFAADVAAHISKEVPSIEGIDPVSREESDSQIKRKNKYRPVPVIRKVGPKEVRPEWMHFIEDTVYEKKTRTAQFKNIPTTSKIAELLENYGTMTLEALPGGKTKRTIKGELKIKVFILGAVAERVIYPHAEKILNEEARALNNYIKAHKA
jgi:Protein of unknown function (DUF2505)